MYVMNRFIGLSCSECKAATCFASDLDRSGFGVPTFLRGQCMRRFAWNRSGSRHTGIVSNNISSTFVRPQVNTTLWAGYNKTHTHTHTHVRHIFYILNWAEACKLGICVEVKQNQPLHLDLKKQEQRSYITLLLALSCSFIG